MNSVFLQKLNDAKKFLDDDFPYWTDDFVRPQADLFADFLKQKEYEIYHLNFTECWEDVFAPIKYQPDDLREVAVRRANERQQGIAESDLSFV